MKKFYSIVAIVAATISANAQTPLNTNGSLEDWPVATTEPAGWYMQSKLDSNLASRGTTGSQDGEYHLIIAQNPQPSGNNTITLQDIVVSPNSVYTVSFYYKSDVGANFKPWIQFRDATDTAIPVQNNPAQPADNYAVVSEWTFESITFTTPANTVELRVGFRNYAGANAYIDNVMVYEGTASLTENNIEGLNVYPNPATDIVTISSFSMAPKHVQLFDMVGKKVMDVETTSTINVSELNKGIYVMKITEAGKTATRKLVVK